MRVCLRGSWVLVLALAAKAQLKRLDVLVEEKGPQARRDCRVDGAQHEFVNKKKIDRFFVSILVLHVANPGERVAQAVCHGGGHVGLDCFG